MMCIIKSMIQTYQNNSVSKNNFLSLMRSYEVNYRDLVKLVDINIINIKNLNKIYQSLSSDQDKKLSLQIKSVTNHTAEIRFSYNFPISDLSYNFVDLKIYFDSKQAEIISSKNNRYKKICSNISSFHNIRLSKWYKNYSVSHWISACLKNGYSFDAKTEV